MGEQLIKLQKTWGFLRNLLSIISERKGLTYNSAAEAGYGNPAESQGDGLDTETPKRKAFKYGAFYFTPDGDFRHFYAGADCMTEFVTILKISDPHYSLMRVMEFYRDETEKGTETE